MSLNAAKINPLFRLAAIRGSKPTVELFLRRGENLDARDENGFTPLMLAAMGDNITICELLLDGGADPSARNNEGDDVFDLLRKMGKRELMALLSLKTKNNKIQTIQQRPDEPKEPNAVPDEAGWEHEHIPVKPVQDDTCLVEASERRRRDMLLVAQNTDEDWSDIAAAFSPTKKAKLEDGADTEVDPQVWIEIRKLLLKAMVSRVASEEHVCFWLERYVSPEDAKKLSRLTLAHIEMLDAYTDEYCDVFDFDDAPLSRAPIDREMAREAGQRIKHEFLGFSESLNIHKRKIAASGVLGASDQQILCYQIRQFRKDMLALLAQSGTAMQQIANLIGEIRKTPNRIVELVGEEVGFGVDAVISAAAVVTEDVKAVLESQTPLETLLGPVEAIYTQMVQSGGPGKDPRLLRYMLRELERIHLPMELVERLSNNRPSDVEDGRILEKLRLKIHQQRKIQNQFVSSNLRLVLWLAKRYVGKGVDIEDLIQEGSIGLLKASERFDYSFGTKFSTYAVWWIRQAMTRAIADTSRTIRIPVHLFEKLQRVRRKMDGPDALQSFSELADELEITDRRLEFLLNAAQDPIAVDAVDEDDCPSDLRSASTISTESEIIKRDSQKYVGTILHLLSAREKHIISLRFGFGNLDEHTLEEVGSSWGLTRERIRQIEAKALRKLLQKKNIRDMRGYLEDLGA
ncbi:MAG: sigma-70 family RNA polymerase sigma factor [Alphaproteobacteria bacterium]|nr:sigma-70 family RNA polymerase sigma factor [Alphaproteobacteria bacterium]